MEMCTGDEGGPSGSAIRSLIQSYRELLRGGERRGHAGTMIPAGTVERGERKRTAAEASQSA